MAYRPDNSVLTGVVIRRLSQVSGDLTVEESAKLAEEIRTDPEGLGLAKEGAGPREIANRLNDTGRARELLGGVILDALDVVQATSGGVVAAQPPQGDQAQPPGPAQRKGADTWRQVRRQTVGPWECIQTRGPPSRRRASRDGEWVSVSAGRPRRRGRTSPRCRSTASLSARASTCTFTI